MKAFAGLSEADARARLHAEGHNELPQPDRRTPFRIAIEVLREPMLALLLVGGIVYLVLGDLKEAFATMSIVITVVQETRTERVLEALRDLTSPRALVIRDGQRQRIAGRDAQDRRFDRPEWEYPLFNLMAQAFLLGQQWWHNATTGVRGVAKQHEAIVEFSVRQMLDVLSPSNFAATNPEVLRKSFESGGANFLRGWQNFCSDYVMRRPPRAPDEPLFTWAR